MIALYRGESLASRVIRWATWSPYSHVAWIDDDNGDVYEAWGKGVVRAGNLLANHTNGTPIEVFTVAGETHERRCLIRYAMAGELGKPYDFRGVLGFVSRRAQAQSQDRWFCSELVFHAYRQAGIDLLSRIPAFKVTPGLLSYSPMLVTAGGRADVP